MDKILKEINRLNEKATLKNTVTYDNFMRDYDFVMNAYDRIANVINDDEECEIFVSEDYLQICQDLLERFRIADYEIRNGIN